jgi:hypothetical protein
MALLYSHQKEVRKRWMSCFQSRWMWMCWWVGQVGQHGKEEAEDAFVWRHIAISGAIRSPGDKERLERVEDGGERPHTSYLHLSRSSEGEERREAFLPSFFLLPSHARHSSREEAISS